MGLCLARMGLRSDRGESLLSLFGEYQDGRGSRAPPDPDLLEPEGAHVRRPLNFAEVGDARRVHDPLQSLKVQRIERVTLSRDDEASHNRYRLCIGVRIGRQAAG